MRVGFDTLQNRRPEMHSILGDSENQSAEIVSAD
jgi:hypothetical protein